MAKIISVLHVRNEKRQQETDGESEENSQR
jgi:hypothetical protein